MTPHTRASRDERDALRPLPANVDIEQMFLGGLLMDNDSASEGVALLKPEHFSEAVHAMIFEVAQAQLARKELASPFTVSTYLPAAINDELTMSEYLARLCATAAPAMIVSSLAKQILDLAARRAIIEIGRATVEAAFNPPPDILASDIVGKGVADLSATTEGVTRVTRRDIGSSAGSVIARARRVQAGTESLATITTGLPDLDAATGGYAPGDLWIMAGRPGMGKAQPLDAKVRTATDGWLPMGEMRVGCALASMDGRASQVTGVYPRGRMAVYRVGFSDGRSTEVCADHLWSVTYRDWDGPRVLNTLQLAEKLDRKRYKNRLWIPFVEGTAQHGECGRGLPVDPWLLGALIGNGCFQRTSISFSTNDPLTLAKVREKLPSGITAEASGPYCYRLTRGRTGYRNALLESLRELNLSDTLSAEKHIPRIYLDADYGSRLALLQGLMDTDGWAEKFGAARYSTASPILCENIIELARSLGFWASFKQSPAYVFDKNGPQRKLDAYRISISGKNMDSVFTLPRKQERVQHRSASRSLTVSSIEFQRYAECQCISVSHPSHLYVTDDYIVTHNSSFIPPSARGAASVGAGVAVFELELPEAQMTARFLAEASYTYRSPIRFGKIMRAEVSERDIDRLEEAQRALNDLPIMIDVAGSLTMNDITARVRSEKSRMAKRGVKLGVVFIDQLDFVKTTGNWKGDKNNQVGEISIGCKQLAKDDDVCVVLFSQLNRGVEGRDDKRPSLMDLRNSGNLEQDADVVGFFYRDAYYIERSSEFRRGDPDAKRFFHDKINSLELILAKNRTGEVKTIELFCDVGSSVIGRGLDGDMR
jgi:replicative DNA helicase